MLRRLSIPVLIVLCWFNVASALTEVSVTYSNRLIPHGIRRIRRSRKAASRLFSRAPDRSIWPLRRRDFTRLDASTFSYVFAWDESGPVKVRFVDALNDTTYAVAIPEPAMPFDPSLHQMPVIHVQTDPANLWDPETGIYVWGNYENFLQHGSEWERPATFDFYDGTTDPVLSFDIGLRINGGWSRHYDQKGLRFYFDRGNPQCTEYDFFQSEPALFKRLLCRTHRNPKFAIVTDMAETPVQRPGASGQSISPCRRLPER